MVKHIFLDLDDTLLDFLAAERAAISETLIHFGFEPSEATILRYSEINRLEWKKLERGEAAREVILTERFKILFDELGSDTDAKAVRTFYEAALAEQAFLIDGATELLDALFGHYRLYIASNGTAEVARRRISLAGIEKYFDGIFISSELSAAKPSAEFFERCFRKIENFSRAEAIIVGDSLTSDILGGKNAGILTCLYSKNGKFTGDIIPDYKIKSLGELPKLLEKL